MGNKQVGPHTALSTAPACGENSVCGVPIDISFFLLIKIILLMVESLGMTKK